MGFHRKLALIFPLLLLSPVMASLPNSVDNHVALTSHNLVLNNCKKFNQSDLNIEMQLICAGSRLQLYTLKAGNQEFVKLAKNNQIDVADNKSAVLGQYKDLNNAINIAQKKSDLLGAISVNSQVAAMLSLDKEITFLKKLDHLNLTTKQITNQYAIAPSRGFALMKNAYAEKFALSAPDKLDIKDYINLCQHDADRDRKKKLQVKLDDFCSPLESRELERDGFELKTGNVTSRCQKKLLEKASSNLLQKQCSGNAQCEESPTTKQQTQKSAEEKLKEVDVLEKQCFRGVKNVFSMSDMASSVLTAAVYRYIQYDQYFAKKYHDPDHANTSSIARLFTKNKYTKKESSKDEIDEFIKTFTNIKYFENKMRTVVSGQDIAPLSDIPFKNNHGLPEVLTKPENSNVLTSKTPGIPKNLNSGNTSKQLHKDFQKIADEIAPLMTRLRNTLIYLEIENSDGLRQDDEINQLLNELGLSKSNIPSNKSSFIFLSPAIAAEEQVTLSALFETLMPISTATDDSSISIPQKRYVLFNALKNLTNEVKLTTDKSIMEGQQNKKKLEEFLKISSTGDLLFLNLFQYFIDKLIPDSYASTVSASLKMDCITSGCRPLSSILSANKDQHPIREQLKPYVDLYTQLIDEINDKKALTPRASQLLQQINSSKVDLDKLQNEMENEYYLHLDKIGKGSSNLSKQTNNFLSSSLQAMNVALFDKNLSLMDIKQNLFLNLSNEDNTLLVDTLTTSSSSDSITNEVNTFSKPTPGNQSSGTFQESTYLGSDADKDADINPDHSGSLFENISKKYQFIYYIRPR